MYHCPSGRGEKEGSSQRKGALESSSGRGEEEVRARERELAELLAWAK